MGFPDTPTSPLPTQCVVFQPSILQFPSFSGKQVPRAVRVRPQHDHVLATGKADKSVGKEVNPQRIVGGDVNIDSQVKLAATDEVGFV